MQVVAELQAAGLNPEAISGIMAAMQVRSLEDLQQLLGDDTPAVQQLQRLFRLARGYGFQDWVVFDASVVRGLAYYTGKHWNLAYCSFQSVGTWRTVPFSQWEPDVVFLQSVENIWYVLVCGSVTHYFCPVCGNLSLRWVSKLSLSMYAYSLVQAEMFNIVANVSISLQQHSVVSDDACLLLVV